MELFRMPQGNGTRPPDDSPPPDSGQGSGGWIKGKSEQELLAELRTYLSRLQADPHSLPDRLRVAAIQLRLGRIDEAMVHYDGVIRGYAALGQFLSAAALCQKLLRLFPDSLRIRSFLHQINTRLSTEGEEEGDTTEDRDPTEEITTELTGGEIPLPEEAGSEPSLELLSPAQNIEELPTLPDIPEPAAGPVPRPRPSPGGAAARERQVNLDEADFLDTLMGEDDPWQEDTGADQVRLVDPLSPGRPVSWRGRRIGPGEDDESQPDAEATAKTARFVIRQRPIVLDHVKAVPDLSDDMALEGDMMGRVIASGSLAQEEVPGGDAHDGAVEGEIEMEDASGVQAGEEVVLLTRKKPKN